MERDGAQARRRSRGARLAALNTSDEVKLIRHRDAKGLAGAARGMLAQQNDRVIQSLEKIAVPTLVLVGANDTNFLAATDYMAAKIKGATKAVVPDAGHAANLHQPALVQSGGRGLPRQAAGSIGRGTMGKRIAVVGVGALGGYVGGWLAHTGHDVTLIDFWPENIEAIRKHGLELDGVTPEEKFTVNERQDHAPHRGAALSTPEADRHRLRLGEVLRHRMGDDADQAVPGAGRLRRVAAELPQRGAHRRHRRLGQDASASSPR